MLITLDQRFLSTQFQKIVPISAMDQDSVNINFQLEALSPPNVYLLHKTLIQCNVIITKQNGSLPDTTAMVGPANNVLVEK